MSVRLNYGQYGDAQPTKGFQRAATRERFSQYLPWTWYDQENRVYLTQDDQFGYCLETTPLPFAGEKTAQTLLGLLNTAFPRGTVVTYSLMADPRIDHILRDFAAGKTRPDPLVQNQVRSLAEHMRRIAPGVEQTNGLPLRNYRNFISIKAPTPLPDDILSSVLESLSMFGSRYWEPGGEDGLLETHRRLFSNLREPRSGTWNPDRELRRQVIDAGYPIEFGHGDARTVKIGDQYGRCITPQALPSETDLMRMNAILGGYGGPSDDTNQINAPFLYSVSIIYDEVKSALATKANIVTSQKATGTIASAIARQCEEMMWATDKARDTPFVRVLPILWVFGDTPDHARDAASRVQRLWESSNFAVQQESHLTRVLLPAALPLGMVSKKQDLTLIDRDFIMPVDAAAQFIPLQADFRGAGGPVQLLAGRKGQLMSVDLFDSHLNNHNFMVGAESGAGKSFFLNSLLFSNYAEGAKIRLIDIGYSYKKITNIVGGRFIDVGDKDNVTVINPFDSGSEAAPVDQEDLDIEIDVATAVLQLMVTSATKGELKEEDVNLLKKAATYVYASGRQYDGIGAAVDFLADFETHAMGRDKAFTKTFDHEAKKLAFNLSPFAPGGQYGKYFNGRSTLNIANDDWVVLELEELKSQPQLFAVIVGQVLNLVTQDLYLSNRSDPRFILFEEAAAFLKETMGGDMTKLFAGIIEAGFRRARKYRGSLGVVLQSVLDIESFGDVGSVIWENAGTKFLLQGKSYTKASAQKVIPYQGFALDTLNSVKNNKPKYSEVFIHSDLGMGVGRLIVDPHGYYMFSSDGRDVARYNRLIEAGAQPSEAIDALARGYEEDLIDQLVQRRAEAQRQADELARHEADGADATNPSTSPLMSHAAE